MAKTKSNIGFSNSIDQAEVSYAGVQFDSTRAIEIKAVPFYGDDGITFLGIHRTLTITGVIHDESGSSDYAEYMQQIMLKPRRELIIRNAGIADIVINSGNDINDGPKPESLTLTPIGSTRAYQFNFIVTITIPANCGESEQTGFVISRKGKIRHYQYSIQWSINEKGFTTRTISGYLEIDRRAEDRTISANDFRSEVKKATPALVNFHRTWDFTETEDKKRLQFTVTDRQIESYNAYPFGCTHISARHRVRWARGKRAAELTNNLSVDITLAPGVKRGLGYKIFLDILLERKRFAEKNKCTVFLESLELDEDIFGYDCNFSASWRVLGKVSSDSTALSKITSTGIFTDLKYTGQSANAWEQWKINTPGQNPKDRIEYGNANLHKAGYFFGFANNCTNGLTYDTRALKEEQIGIKYYDPVNKKNPLQNEMPPKEDSYLHYNNGLSETTSHDLEVIKRIEETERARLVPDNTKDADKQFQGEVAYGNPGYNGTDLEIQTSGNPTTLISMIGRAIRVGYPIPKPDITKIGDRTAHLENEKFTQTQVAECFGVAVYAATWIMTYVIDNSPGTITLPRNFQQEQQDGAK